MDEKQAVRSETADENAAPGAQPDAEATAGAEPTDRSGEPHAEAAAETAAVAEPELHQQLQQARDEAGTLRDQLIRARAQIDNLHKRHERELESAHKYAVERFVQELLQVKDSLELGLSHAGQEGIDPDKLREGSELTLKLLGSVFEKFAVAEVDPAGEPFNPELHQAMTMQDRDDVPANTVVTVVQKGYTLHGRIVRPALVIVSRQPAPKVDEQA